MAKKTALQFSLLVVLWAVLWPVSKAALSHSPPLLFVGIRILSSGLLLWLWIFARRRHVRARFVVENIVLGIFNVILFFGLQTIALTSLSAGLLSMLIFLQPMFTVVLAHFYLRERMNLRISAGILLGLIGILYIGSPFVQESYKFDGVLLGIGSGLAWAIGTVAYKKFPTDGDVIRDVATQFTFGGIILFAIGLVREPWRQIHWTTGFLAELAYLSLLGTAVAWVLWAHLLSQSQAVKVSSYTLLVPVLATILSSLFLSEALSLPLVGGGICVVTGLYLVNKPSRSGLPKGDAFTL